MFFSYYLNGVRDERLYNSSSSSILVCFVCLNVEDRRNSNSHLHGKAWTNIEVIIYTLGIKDMMMPTLISLFDR